MTLAQIIGAALVAASVLVACWRRHEIPAWLVIVLALSGTMLTGFGGGVAFAQARAPLASAADEVLAPLAVSTDGKEFTFRAITPDATRICVDPAVGAFGPQRCFTVGDIRRGLVRKGQAVR